MADGIITRRGGQSGCESKVIDLSITIDLTEPTPVRVGHVWVKADIASSITNIQVLKALKANAPDGTLFLIFQTDEFSVLSENTLSLTSSQEVSVHLESSVQYSKWVLSNTDEGETINKIVFKNNPIVYSKLDGVLDIETSYVWDGTSWVTLCEKGSYFVGALNTTDGLCVYNFANDQVLTKAASFKDPNSGINYKNIATESTGRYFAFHTTSIATNTGLIVVKRVGDVFTIVASLPTFTSVGGLSGYLLASAQGFTNIQMGSGEDTFRFSHTGKYLYAQYFASSSVVYLVIYRRNDTTDTYEKIQEIQIHRSGVRIQCNEYDDFITRELLGLTGAGQCTNYYVIDEATGLYVKKYTGNTVYNGTSFVDLANVNSFSWLVGRKLVIVRFNNNSLDIVDLSTTKAWTDSSIHTSRTMTGVLLQSEYGRKNKSIVHPNGIHVLMYNGEDAIKDTLFVLNVNTKNLQSMQFSAFPICFSLDGSKLYYCSGSNNLGYYNVVFDSNDNMVLTMYTLIVSGVISTVNGNQIIPSVRGY